MDVTTELLDNAAFREAKRGYNTQDVDEWIERLKEGIERDAAQLKELRTRAEAAESRVEEAERRAAEAAEQAGGSSEMDETLKRTLVLAQRTADAAVKEAEEEAARTLAAAKDQSERLLADAKDASARARADAENEAYRAQEEARAKVLAEITELEAARDQMHNDAEALTVHLDEQRGRVRFAASELQRLVDDPSALQAAAVPELSDVTVTEAVDTAASDDQADDEADDGGEAESAVAGGSGLPRREPSSSSALDEPADSSAATLDAEPEAELDDEGGTESEPEAIDSDDGGPPTRAVPTLPKPESDDDEYLAELRKAMTDDSPLGPREEDEQSSLFSRTSSDNEPGRSRFGRRR